MVKGLLTKSKTCNKMAKDVMYKSPTYSEIAHGVTKQKVQLIWELHTTVESISL